MGRIVDVVLDVGVHHGPAGQAEPLGWAAASEAAAAPWARAVAGSVDIVALVVIYTQGAWRPT